VLLPEVADVLRRLPPEAKRKVRAALAELRRDPDLGEPLERQLAVYRPSPAGLEVVAIGPRRTIYTEVERAARQR